MAERQITEWPLIGMTIEETAAALRVDALTVRKLMKQGGLPCRKCGKEWRIDPDALKAWLGAGTYDGGKRADAE